MSDEFVVNDKRLFSKDGQINSGVAESGESAPDDKVTDGTSNSVESESSSSASLPPANFTGLLIGLATSAFIHLGEGPEQGAGQGPDLPAAKHAIDILAVLQEKTKGNLQQEEESLLTTLLYDLRLKYVQASGQK